MAEKVISSLRTSEKDVTPWTMSLVLSFREAMEKILRFLNACDGRWSLNMVTTRGMVSAEIVKAHEARQRHGTRGGGGRDPMLRAGERITHRGRFVQRKRVQPRKSRDDGFPGPVVLP